MDPLSITASIIAVLQLTTSLVSCLSDIQHATSDQRKLAIEAASLMHLLTNLRYRVEGAQENNEWFDQARSLGAPHGPLDQFQSVLKDMVEQTAPSTARTKVRIVSALKWKFTKPKVDASLQHVERLKSLVLIALENDAFKLSQAIHGGVNNLESSVQQLQHGVDQLRVQADGDNQAKLSRWLRIPDPSTNYHAAQKKRHPGTGSWLLNNEAFKSWIASTSSLMWLFGKAGCGKTVLSATVLEHLLQTAMSQPSDVTVVYFYFDFNDLEKQRSESAIRSLLFQFALQSPSGLQDVQKLYQNCSDGSRQPNDDQVRSLLHHLIGQVKQNYIVLDAIDECQDQLELCTFIEEFAKSPRSNACILATSRPERDIEVSIRPVANHVIDVQSSVVDSDIDAYVRDRLNADRKLKKWPMSVKEEIAVELLQKADGMFRWVYCQLESLQRCVQLRDLRRALLTLPQTLDETYTRIIQSIESEGHLRSAVKILQWLCFAGRPLLHSELLEIFAIETGEGTDVGFDPDERLPDPNDIMTICSSMISRYSNTESSNNQEDWARGYDADTSSDLFDTGSVATYSILPDSTTWIRLAHFSVKEFLLSDRCPLRSEFYAATCHAIISEGCLHYLTFISRQQVPGEVIRHEYPLADYAAALWWQHAQDAKESSRVRIVNLSYNFLTTRDTRLLWLYLSGNGHHGSSGSETMVDRPPLILAARTGLLQVVMKLIADRVDVNARSTYGHTPLHAAVLRGDGDMVRMLIDAGAEVKMKGGEYDITILQSALRAGDESILRMLIKAGANFNVAGEGYTEALLAASYGGHTDVVRLLLDVGAHVNRPDYDRRCDALMAATLRGHLGIVRMLIAAGAKPNTCMMAYGTSLCSASLSGYGEILQVLIDAGADLNVQGERNGTALASASRFGHEKVVQILIEAGADLNIQGQYYGTALACASRFGHEKVVQMLIDAGADLDIGGHNGCSALQYAIFYRYDKIARMLIDAGARNSDT